MRRRYIQVDGELVEVSRDYAAPARNSDSVLWNDRSYQDANDPRFSSRSQHREYMKREGLTTVDDFRSHFANARVSRERFYRGEDSTRRADIARALDKARG